MKDTESYARLVHLYVAWGNLWSLHSRREGIGAEGDPNGHPNCVAAKALAFEAMGVVLREAGLTIRLHESHGSFYWHILVAGVHVAGVSMGTPNKDLRVSVYDELRANVRSVIQGYHTIEDVPAAIRKQLAHHAEVLGAQADKIARLSRTLADAVAEGDPVPD